MNFCWSFVLFNTHPGDDHKTWPICQNVAKKHFWYNTKVTVSFVLAEWSSFELVILYAAHNSSQYNNHLNCIWVNFWETVCILVKHIQLESKIFLKIPPKIHRLETNRTIFKLHRGDTRKGKSKVFFWEDHFLLLRQIGTRQRKTEQLIELTPLIYPPNKLHTRQLFARCDWITTPLASSFIVFRAESNEQKFIEFGPADRVDQYMGLAQLDDKQ